MDRERGGPPARRVAAIDLGATSGRVIAVSVGADGIDLDEVHRFANGPVEADDGSLRWDVAALWDGIVTGLRAAGPVESIGIDSWAVDYALLDADGELLGQPYCYRDDRGARAVEAVHARVDPTELYQVTGLQHLPFNTIYQVAAEPSLDEARTMLLLPDLFAYWLTGVVGAETTNASTTQLFDARTRDWSRPLAERAGIPARLLADLRRPGDVIGTLLPDVAERCGQASSTPVIAVGSHDTASAVAGTPLSDPATSAYISSGTWSLVGLELPEPVLSDDARSHNFTNEAGVDGTVRFLRNVMGLWVLSQSMEHWGRDDLDSLLAEAAAAGPGGPVIDVDDPSFISPGDMPARIDAACRATAQEPPATPGATVRCILDSLALAYRETVRAAASLAGRKVREIHVVGGGARNDLLCQLTADACGVPVHAGPVEATALGNALVQVRALGAPAGVELSDLRSMRRLVDEAIELHMFNSAPNSGAHWDQATARVGR